MAADLGTDVYCIDDIDPAFGVVTGPKAVAMAIARRLGTPRGALFYDGDYGYDLVGLLNAGIDTRMIFQISAGIEAEALKDERVRSAEAAVTYDAQTETLRAVVRGDTSEGPFQLVIAASDTTVEILRAG